MVNFTKEEIVKNWKGDSDNPLVSIRCIAFNQKNYIEEALDSFLTQKTTFPFEVVVHDDASTDGTDSIIKEYENKFPDIVRGLYETENQYSKHDGSLPKIINSALKGKYVAFCEGDDYWLDENKLQKQVDFLESNPDYGLCYSQTKIFSQKENRLEENTFGFSFNGFDDLVQNGNCIPTLTVCLRWDLYKKYLEEVNPYGRHWLMGDYPAWLYFASKSKIKFFEEATGVYRVLGESLSHSKDPKKQAGFIKSTIDIQKFFFEFAGKNIEESRSFNATVCDMCNSLKDTLLMDINPELASMNGKATEVLGLNGKLSDENKIYVFYKYASDPENQKVSVFQECPIVFDAAEELTELRLAYMKPTSVIKVKELKADGRNARFTSNASFVRGNTHYFNGNLSILFFNVDKKAKRYVFDVEVKSIDEFIFNEFKSMNDSCLSFRKLISVAKKPFRIFKKLLKK